MDTNACLCCSKVLSLTNLKYEKKTNNFPLEPGERRYISSTYTLVDVKMLQLFVPELYRNKAVQTQKPYAILIPLLQMVVKEAIGSVFCFRHLTHT